MIVSILNLIADHLLCFRRIRKAVRCLLDRSMGFQFGSYSLSDEADLAATVIRHNRLSGFVIDGGTNRGDWTRALLRVLPKANQILMVEPAPSHVEVLGALVSQYEQVSFASVGLGAESGKLPLYYDQSGSSCASLYPRQSDELNSFTQKVEVSIESLDRLIEARAIQEVAYLKLDLEGHELEALRGAHRLLASRRIHAICFEFGGCHIDSRTYFKDFWNLLSVEYGYTLYRLLPRRRLLRLERYSEDLECFRWQNILACAPNIFPEHIILGE